LANCVYFNTMYNAKRDFRNAKRLERDRIELRKSEVRTVEEENLYKSVIKRCAKIISKYPDSKWVDDALFLMGNAYFELGKFDSAGYKYDELLRLFPKSKWSDDAFFIKGRTLLSRGQFAKADSIFNYIATELSGGDYADDAQLMLAESAFKRDALDTAITAYKKLLHDYPKSPLRHDARKSLGDCYYRSADYQKALDVYREMVNDEPPKPIWFYGVYRIGKCLIELGRIDEAEKHLRRIYKKRLNPVEKGWIRVELERITSIKGDHEAAIKALKEVAEKNKKTDLAAEAWFNIGTIYQDSLKNLDEARKAYDQARKEAPKSTAATEALIRTTGLDKLAGQSGAARDTTGRAARNQLILAELYLFRMNNIAKAMAEYQSLVDNYPGTYYAAQALYAMAYLAENVQGKPEAAKNYLRELVDNYPPSKFTILARRKLGLPVDQAMVDSTAESLYLEAEKLLIGENNPDSAMKRFETLAANNPATPLAPKSLLALGWVLENYKHNPDSAAAVYRKLAETYPDHPAAATARARVELFDKTKAKKEKPGKSKEQIGGQQRAPRGKQPPSRSTTPQKPRVTEKAKPAAPTPPERKPNPTRTSPPKILVKAEPVLPAAAEAEGISGTVQLNVLVDKKGGVSKVIPIKGPKSLYEAATEAAKRSKFAPAYRVGKPAPGWVAVSFTFKPKGKGEGETSGEQSKP